MSKCPTCQSSNPSFHPAVQHEGEVHLCRDPWHKPTAAEIEAKWAADDDEPMDDATRYALGAM